MSNIILGSGNSQAKLFIVGDFPSYYEETSNQPFQGPHGTVLSNWLYENNISRDECYFTYLYKYIPKDGDIKKIDLTLAARELWIEINAIKPNCILTLGEYSFRTLTGQKGITQFRGSIIPSTKGHPKVVATYNPTNFTNINLVPKGERCKFSYIHICKLDVARAYEESKSHDFNMPKRHLWYATSAYQVLDFFQRNKDKKRAAVDIETYKQGATLSLIHI